MTIRNALASCLLASTALLAMPAFGQASVQDPVATPAEQDPSGEDIVVTAQKIEQRAVDVPITISAVTGERIRQLGVGDLDELSNYIPGLNIQEQSANNPGIVIRGITSDSGSAQQGPRVTLYYNGVDISRSRGSYQAIYDLERVEVIKGPQATLFGTASAIGAISITSARPREGFSAALTGGYGNYDSTLLSGFVNAGNDTLGGRVAFEWKTRDGYVENIAASQTEDLYAQDQLGVRASLRWTPTDALTVDLIGTYDRQRNGGTPFVSRALPTQDGPGNPLGRTRDLELIGVGRKPLEADLARVAAAQGLRIVPEENTEAGWYYRSDHYALAQKGVPGVYFPAGRDIVNRGPAAGERERARYNAQCYHQTCDEFSSAWDMTGAAQEGSVAYALGHEIADGTRWPTWNASEPFGTERAKTESQRH